MSSPKIKRPPIMLADYLVAHTSVLEATDKARDLIIKGYEPWGCPVLANDRWTQTFILKEMKEVKEKE